MINNNIDRTMRLPFIILFLFVPIVLAFAVGMLIVDAQTIKKNNQCGNLDVPLEYTINLTDVVIESYSLEKDSARYVEIVDILHEAGSDLYYDRLGSESGFYSINGMWAAIDRVDAGYRVWAGSDWTVGKDKQLHNPTCYLVVPKSYEVYFMRHPKCWYPYNCDRLEFFKYQMNPTGDYDGSGNETD